MIIWKNYRLQYQPTLRLKGRRYTIETELKGLPDMG